MQRQNTMHESELIRECINDFPNDAENAEWDNGMRFDVLSACEVYFMNGQYDDIGGDVEAPTGHYYRIHRWIVTTDDRGFHELFTFDSEEEAEADIARLNKEYAEWGDA